MDTTHSVVIRELSESLGRRPGARELRARLAWLLLESGDGAGALAHFEQVLRQDPGDASALTGAREAAWSCGEVARAKIYGERARSAQGVAAESAGPAWWQVALGGRGLAGLCGATRVKAALEKRLVHPLCRPEVLGNGCASGPGILLYGPPGSGKSALASALGEELGGRFLAISAEALARSNRATVADFILKVNSIAARLAPCVVFLDDIDAGCGKVTAGNFNPVSTPRVSGPLLRLLDRLGRLDGVALLGATSRPWAIDPWLLRPGRFGQTLLVPAPDYGERVAILEQQLADRPVLGADIRRLAGATDGWTPGELAGLVARAGLRARARAVVEGGPWTITGDDLVAAVSATQPAARLWFERIETEIEADPAKSRRLEAFSELAPFLARLGVT